MSRIVCSLILVPICALLNFSCSHSAREIPAAQISETPSVEVSDQSFDLFKTEVDHPAVNVVERPHRIEKFLHKVSPKPQQYSFPADDETLIMCENGSVLKFDPGIFVYAGTNDPVTGKIDMSVTEYLTAADMIFGGLETKCGKDVIETGGMMYIEAKSDGKKCEIADGEFYSIEMPAYNNKDGMQYFYAEENSNGTDWTPMNKGSLLAYQNYNTYSGEGKNYLVLQDLLNKKESHSMKAEFPGGLKAMYQFLHDNYKIPPGFENTTLHATSYVNFTLDANGKLLKVYTPKQITTYADKEILAAFKKMPNWKVDFTPGAKKKMMMPVKMDLVRDPSKIPVKEEMLFKPEVERYQATYAADRYLMNASQIGWINCDRFVQSQSERVAFFVPADSSDDIAMRIVFHSIRAVMGGERYTKGFEFQNIPKDEMVTIVAMRIKDDGTTELAMKTCSVSDQNIHPMDFHPATEAEMRKQFERLGEMTAPATASL